MEDGSKPRNERFRRLIRAPAGTAQGGKSLTDRCSKPRQSRFSSSPSSDADCSAIQSAAGERIVKSEATFCIAASIDCAQQRLALRHRRSSDSPNQRSPSSSARTVASVRVLMLLATGTKRSDWVVARAAIDSPSACTSPSDSVLGCNVRNHQAERLADKREHSRERIASPSAPASLKRSLTV